MTKARLLSAALTGNTVTLTAAQGTKTATESIPSWGLSDSTEVPVSAKITARRSSLATAPERVFFSVTVDGFETKGPDDLVYGDGGVYDPQKHDLIYVWDFGDPGSTYTAPEKLLPEHRDANTGFGPFVSHVYERPGSYTVSCTIIEPSSNEYATVYYGIGADNEDLKVSGDGIPVGDPDLLFAGGRTVYVDPDGTGTAPAGAILQTNLRKALDYPKGKAGPYRIMLRRDVSYDLEEYRLDTTHPDEMHIVAEAGAGAGAKPVIRFVNGAPYTYYKINTQFEMRGPNNEVVFSDIDFVGLWDATTETGDGNDDCFLIQSGADFQLDTFLVHNCSIYGFQRGVVTSAVQPNTGGWVLSNTHIGGWRDYGYYGSGASDFGIIGCRIAQNVDALAGGDKDGTHNGHGPIRHMAHDRTVIDACDLFTRCGWVQNVEGYRTQQPCIRWNMNQRSGALGNIQRCAMEGGWQIIHCAATNTDEWYEDNTVRPQNLLIERNVFVGSHMTRYFLYLGHGGLTIRNNLMIAPDVERVATFFRMGSFVTTASNYIEEANAFALPVRFYHNTLVNLMSAANAGTEAGAIINVGGFSNVLSENNLEHQPNLAPPIDAYAPLDQTVLWTPREKGYISSAVPVLDTTLASPADTVRRSSPQAKSPALGAAEGTIEVVRDLPGNPRPPYPSIGALEALD